MSTRIKKDLGKKNKKKTNLQSSYKLFIHEPLFRFIFRANQCHHSTMSRLNEILL